MAAAKGNNSKLIIGIIAVVILALLGFGTIKLLKKSSSSSVVPAVTQSGNVFTSIKDALAKSISLQCSFSDQNGVKTTAYIKAGAVRADTVGKTAEESGSAIIKDKKMYFWNSRGGFVMDFNNTQGNTPPVTPANGNENPTDIMKSLEKYKDSCKPAIISESLFTPPANVKFQDFSQMMKGAGSSVPAAGQEQLQKYLQRISQTPQK